MSVYVITHKPFEWKPLPGYRVLLAGACKGHSFGDLFDDEGDNISRKNGSYCELTGIYWLWKHCTDEYVGITHYRRHFSDSPLPGRIIPATKLEERLRRHDVLLPYSRPFDCTVKEQYVDTCGREKDLLTTREALRELHPDCVGAFDDLMGSRRFAPYNMFVMGRELFGDYCAWLFPLLEAIEQHVDTTGYDNYEKRVIGFLGERLLNVWVAHRRLDVGYVGVVGPRQGESALKRAYGDLRRAVIWARG